MPSASAQNSVCASATPSAARSAASRSFSGWPSGSAAAAASPGPAAAMPSGAWFGRRDHRHDAEGSSLSAAQRPDLMRALPGSPLALFWSA